MSNNYQYKIKLNIQQLVGCDLYFGSHKSNSNPSNNYFLLGRNQHSIEIFNISFSYFCLRRILNTINALLLKKSTIWVVNSNFPLYAQNEFLRYLVSRFKKRVIRFFHEKFYGGGFTNYKSVKLARRAFFPRAIFFPSLTNNWFVVKEASRINIPSFGIVDSFENPFDMFFPVPGNSKSLKTLIFFYFILLKTISRSRWIVAGSFLFAVINRLIKKRHIFNMIRRKRKIYKRRVYSWRRRRWILKRFRFKITWLDFYQVFFDRKKKINIFWKLLVKGLVFNFYKINKFKKKQIFLWCQYSLFENNPWSRKIFVLAIFIDC